VTHEAYVRAVELLASRRIVLDQLRTHDFGFREAKQAIDVPAGRPENQNAVNVVLTHDRL
jgi:hypothetical protein